MRRAVGIFSIKVGMVAEAFGEVAAVERIAVDAVSVTFADGVVRRFNLGSYIYI